MNNVGPRHNNLTPPPSEFKVTTLTPKNPLINNQAVTSIRNLTTIQAYPKIQTYS